jgi:hypothetical protein
VALVECSDCKKSISSAATVCPHCGRPAEEDEHFSPDVVTTFLRSVFEATFRPTHFLVRWREEPRRYWKPNRLLMANGFVGAVAITFVFRFVHMGHAGPSHVPKLAQEILAGVAPLVLAWLAVLGFRLAPRLVGASSDWVIATRMGAFVAAPGLAWSPVALLLMGLTRSQYAGLPISLLIQVVYGYFALRSLVKLSVARSLVGAFIAYVIYIVLWFVVSMVLMSLLAWLGQWVPELKFGV